MGGLLNETSGAEPWSYGDKPSVMRAAALMLGRALPQCPRGTRDARDGFPAGNTIRRDQALYESQQHPEEDQSDYPLDTTDTC